MPIHKSHHSAFISLNLYTRILHVANNFPSTSILHLFLTVKSITVQYITKISANKLVQWTTCAITKNAPKSTTFLIYIITTACKHYSASCFNPVLFLQTKFQVSSIFPILYLSISLLSKSIACRFPFRSHFSPTSWRRHFHPYHTFSYSLHIKIFSADPIAPTILSNHAEFVDW